MPGMLLCPAWPVVTVLYLLPDPQRCPNSCNKSWPARGSFGSDAGPGLRGSRAHACSPCSVVFQGRPEAGLGGIDLYRMTTSRTPLPILHAD